MASAVRYFDLVREMRDAYNNGRLIKITDGLGEENYTYDQLGRTTQVLKKVYNVSYTTSYTFNLAGEVDTMTYPSGRVVKQQYDNIGRLSTVKNNTTGGTQYATSVTYNTASQVTGFSYANGVSTSYGYSANRLQLTSLSYAQGGSNLLSLSYGYSQSGSNNGEIASITDNVESGRTVSYTYDSLHRVSTAETSGSTPYPKWGLSWTYDRFGNRLTQSRTYGSTAPENAPTISTSTNRITYLNATFTYDSNGNLTLDDLYKYKYDAENRLVELRLPNDTLIASYAFDGDSLRVVKVWGADRTFYIYAGTQLISEFEDAASNTYSAGTTPGQAGSDSTATMLYQHNDHLTTRLTTDNSGQFSNDQAHYPYGEQWYAGGTADPSVLRKFTSYQREDEAATGKLNYAVFREHSARVGRFHMADPKRGNAGNPQRLNRYAYVTGNPIIRTDRQGLEGDPGPEDEGWIALIDNSGMGAHSDATNDSRYGEHTIGGWIGAQDAWIAAQNTPAWHQPGWQDPSSLCNTWWAINPGPCPDGSPGSNPGDGGGSGWVGGDSFWGGGWNSFSGMTKKQECILDCDLALAAELLACTFAGPFWPHCGLGAGVVYAACRVRCEWNFPGQR